MKDDPCEVQREKYEKCFKELLKIVPDFPGDASYEEIQGWRSEKDRILNQKAVDAFEALIKALQELNECERSWGIRR